MASTVELPKPIRGIVPPMVTPLAENDKLDHVGLERLVEHVLAGGVRGLFLLGTTGEGPSLSFRLKCELIDLVCEQVAGRVPVLVGATDTSFVESVNLADFAADAGAQAVVLAAPYYYPVGQRELLAYFENIARAMPLPVLLYSIPSHTKSQFEPFVLEQLLDMPNIIGLKESSGDMAHFHRVRRLFARRPNATLMVGPERLLADTVLRGGHGGVCGGSNLFPRLYVDLYEAAAASDLLRVETLHEKVMQVAEGIYTVARHGAGPIKGLKCALSCLGICNDQMAEPFHALGEIARRTIKRRLKELDLPIEAPAPIERG